MHRKVCSNPQQYRAASLPENVFVTVVRKKRNPATNTILFAPFLTVMVMGDGHICGLMDIIEENMQRGASIRASQETDR
ncbi:hypothetical protein J6590_043166 [Homalodisca vitripennis]|nr:hypothetical protein J6590_043166 [Homalodisca vitripennis]